MVGGVSTVETECESSARNSAKSSQDWFRFGIVGATSILDSKEDPLLVEGSLMKTMKVGIAILSVLCVFLRVLRICEPFVGWRAFWISRLRWYICVCTGTTIDRTSQSLSEQSIHW